MKEITYRPAFNRQKKLNAHGTHIAEEAYQLCNAATLDSQLSTFNSVNDAEWPECNEAYLVESTQKYPVQFNGKVRFTIEVAKDTPREEVEKIVMSHELTAKQLNGGASAVLTAPPLQRIFYPHRARTQIAPPQLARAGMEHWVQDASFKQHVYC